MTTKYLKNNQSSIEKNSAKFPVEDFHQGQGETQTGLAMTIIVLELLEALLRSRTHHSKGKIKCVVLQRITCKPTLARLAHGLQDNQTSLNVSQTLSQSIPNFSNS